MAIADKVGHNKRGSTIYKRAPDGSLLLQDSVKSHRLPRIDGTFEEVEVTTTAPMIDDELDEIAEAYHVWLAEQLVPVRKRSERSPDGHPKLLHLWPVKLLQAGRSDGDYTGVAVMREAASFKR